MQTTKQMRKKQNCQKNLEVKLMTAIKNKETFYTEMTRILLVDGGISYDEAKEATRDRAYRIQSTSAIYEKANLLKALKQDALDFLLSTLDSSIEVWEELHPGKGIEEEYDTLNKDLTARSRSCKRFI